MTEAQLIALVYGCIGFVVVAAVMLPSYALVDYVRRGAVDLRRMIAVGAFLLYCCLAVAVVVFPVPGPTTPPLEQTVQLVPLQWIEDVGTEMRKYGLAPTLLNAVSTQTFQQAMLNVALFVPLGMFLRLVWRKGLRSTVKTGALVSFTVEITQLTANFGTAPMVYRVFDVDDLLTNTAGAFLGWLLAAAVLRRNRKDALADTRRMLVPAATAAR